MKRTDIINLFINKYKYKSYLEIGVANPDENFVKINVDNKISVDPNVSKANFVMTSDDFFKENDKKFDIIFIDGLHESEQVYRDVNNSISILNEGGSIIMHDCNPLSEVIQLVPQIQAGEWTGDCWKAWVKIRAERKDLHMFVVDTDYGCGIIRKGSQELITINKELTWELLDKNRKELLNLISVETFLKNI